MDVKALTQEAVERIRAAFERYDKNNVGSVRVFELPFIFNELGQSVTEALVLDILRECDRREQKNNPSYVSKNNGKYDKNSRVEFHTFLAMLDIYRNQRDDRDSEDDIVNTFVALGGKPDKSGTITIASIKELCKRFDLQFEVEKLTNSQDKLTFGDLKSILSKHTEP